MQGHKEDHWAYLNNAHRITNNNWARETSPTLGCSIEISRDIYIYVCRSVGLSKGNPYKKTNTRMLKVSFVSLKQSATLKP